jgi:hypothetical protein
VRNGPVGWWAGSFHSRPGGEFRALDDNFHCIGGVPCDVTQALDRTIIAQDAEEADSGATKDGHRLRRLAGMNPAGILAKVDIAYPVQAIFDGPMAAQNLCQALGIRPGWRQAGDPEADQRVTSTARLAEISHLGQCLQ